MTTDAKVLEQSFYDARWDADKALPTASFYAITAKSKEYYRDWLHRDCSGKQVLEYGCGGPNSEAFGLARLGANAVAIDISPIAVQKSAEIAREQRLSNVTFKVMDGEALDFPEKTFDIIFGSGTLHHLDVDKAYREISRSLKDDGVAIFFEPLSHNPFIALFRKLTPQWRSTNCRPLKVSQLLRAKRYFREVQLTHYHLASLLALPFRRQSFFLPLLHALDSFDEVLFDRLPLLRKYSWFTIIVLKHPIRAQV